MTALDKKFGKLATNMIGKFGKSVTFTSVTAGHYNPETGSTSTTKTSITVKAVVEDYKPREFVDGLILMGDKKFTIAAAGIPKPNPGDKIILSGKDYSVISLSEIWSGEEIAAYEVNGRA